MLRILWKYWRSKASFFSFFTRAAISKRPTAFGRPFGMASLAYSYKIWPMRPTGLIGSAKFHPVSGFLPAQDLPNEVASPPHLARQILRSLSVAWPQEAWRLPSVWLGHLEAQRLSRRWLWLGEFSGKIHLSHLLDPNSATSVASFGLVRLRKSWRISFGCPNSATSEPQRGPSGLPNYDWPSGQSNLADPLGSSAGGPLRARPSSAPSGPPRVPMDLKVHGRFCLRRMRP